MSRLLACLLLSAGPLLAGDGNWPMWRGPHGDGTTDETGFPTRWTETENVVWKTTVPGRGHSSPIVWGDRLFLTTADEDAGTQTVLAFDRKTGKPLWNKVAHKGGLPRKHSKNS